MKNTLGIARRQFVSYFNGAPAYIVISVVLLITGFFFWQQFFLAKISSVRGMWMWLTWSMVIGAPALTMGLVADDRRTGTIELLLTMPVKDGEVILGKFLGVLGLYAVLLTLTLTYPLSVSTLGPLDFGQVAAGYVGMFLLGAALLAIGLVTSSMTSNQMVAFFSSFIICFIFVILDKVLPLIGSEGIWPSIIEWLSFDYHRQSMARGVIDLRDVTFFLAATGIPLLIAFRALESRRWR
ncbi:MAG: ABC transporter permease subunit [Deltaproteobacteria bacterium]|nr:ABC transporter permease subunit [Deltaproteobacteria bacterium]